MVTYRLSLVAIWLAVSLAIVASAQEEVPYDYLLPLTYDNPFTSAEDISAGARIMRLHCGTCHGPEGKGGRGPDLTRGEFRWGSDDESLFLNVWNGIPGTDMATVPILPKQVWQVISYIRSFEGKDSGPIPGDPQVGAQLFAQHNCSTCHWVNGAGGRAGLDLTEIGRRATVEYLRTSILDPDADVDIRHRYVTVITIAGRVLEGRKLNETSQSIQFVDVQGRLHSVLKRDIDWDAEGLIRHETSLMPSFRPVLNERQLTDLVAYLASLGRQSDDDSGEQKQ